MIILEGGGARKRPREDEGKLTVEREGGVGGFPRPVPGSESGSGSGSEMSLHSLSVPSRLIDEKRVLDGFVAAGLLTAEEAAPRLESLRAAARRWTLGRTLPFSPRASSPLETGYKRRGRCSPLEMAGGAEKSESRSRSIVVPKAALGPQGTVYATSKAEREERLREAANVGDVVEVERLLSCKSRLNVNATDAMGRTAIYLACGAGQLAVVKRLCSVPQLDVNKADEDPNGKGLGHGFTPLHKAIEGGHVLVVQALRECKGIDVNRTNWRGDTALLSATAHGNLRVLRELIKVKGIDPNIANAQGWTPLRLAWSQNLTGVVKLLLSIPGIKTHNEEKIPTIRSAAAALAGNIWMQSAVPATTRERSAKTPTTQAVAATRMPTRDETATSVSAKEKNGKEMSAKEKTDEVMSAKDKNDEVIMARDETDEVMSARAEARVAFQVLTSRFKI